MEKILELMPADKQNIVYTNRRSKETQGILDKILKAPEEIKVDRTKEQEANFVAHGETEAPKDKKSARACKSDNLDKEALSLSKKYNSFLGKTPKFLLNKVELVDCK